MMDATTLAGAGMPVLSVENLSIGFGKNGSVASALQDVSFTVHRGELVAVVGESGSGKSISALSVLKLLPSPPAHYHSGRILFRDGEQPAVDLLQSTPALLQQVRGNRIAMVFQEPMTSLNPVHTCGHQVAEALVQHQQLSAAAAHHQTLSLFHQVQLPNPQRIFHSYPHQVSGGQQQRVMIAMAISCQPALLICDEPTTALDVTVQKNILSLIKTLQQQHMGVLFITHDLAVVSEIADRIVVLYKGKIVEQGSAAALLQQPKHPYTQALLACRPALYPRGMRLPVVADFMLPGKAIEGQAAANVATCLPATPVTGEALISAEQLNVWYPARNSFLGRTTSYTKAVDNVSFKVMQGETLGLVGESGCGKTTLGRALLGLVPLTSGSICFKGRPLASMPAAERKALRKNMQLVFQDPYASLNPRMTIGEAIREPLRVHNTGLAEKAQKARVMDLLQQVSLQPEHYHRYPHEFSGGQRQRIVIARALVLQPAFVVCDESVSALDVSVQAQVLNLLNELKGRLGFTTVFISHDLSVIRYLCNRVLVMHQGSIVESGDAEAVYRHPQHPYTRQLVAAIPVLQSFHP